MHLHNVEFQFAHPINSSVQVWGNPSMLTLLLFNKIEQSDCNHKCYYDKFK